MVIYNPKNWFTLIFKFHKAETFSALRWMLLTLLLFSLVVVYVEKSFFPVLIGNPTMHSLLGFVIGLLLVFRTNTAYDRWWEGRKQWGAMVNVSRNFALKLSAHLSPESNPIVYEILRLNKTYSMVLKTHLRDAGDTRLMLQSIPDFARPKEAIAHVPNYVAFEIQKRLEILARNKSLDTALHLALLNDLSQFTDICGACERIKKTPIPYTYNIFLKKFIFVYIITMPFCFVSAFGYWTALVTVFTFYTFASLELIAEEIEDPFGVDSNDLPTDNLADTIGKNVEEIEHFK